MKKTNLAISITMVLGFWAMGAVNASAATWYVRDGGGTPVQCTGTTNAVYPGSGLNQPCALSNPMYVLGAGCGNTGWNTCDRPGVMADGDTLYIVGDSDMNPGTQAQYPIGLDVTGVITPTNGSNCYAPVPENCTMANIPSNASVIGIGAHRPQLWGREQVVQVLNDNNSANTVINNLEITQHSSCVTNGANPAGSINGFPNACHKPNNGFSSPYGNYGLTGVSLTGSNINLQNNWIHGMSYWGVTTGNLSNFTETNNIINGNGAGGVGLGQNISNSGTMSLAGTTTVNGETIVFNGCGSVYPLHSSNPFDTLNYHDCADDSSSNGSILADGWGMEAGSGICNLVNMSNTNVSYNTKGGIDNLHCNGTGTFNAYRVRAEGNESQQLKLNYGAVNIENSQIINDCNFFQGQSFTAVCDSYGNCPPVNGHDFCRAAGDGLVFAVPNTTTSFNVSNSTLYSNGGTNIELTTSWCGGGNVALNVNNSLVIGAPDYTNGDAQQTRFWENDAGSCAHVVENNNLVYHVYDPQDCAGSHDICSNPANAGVSGNFNLNSSFVYTGTGLADQFYPTANSPLIGTAGVITLNGTSNDYNNNARGTSWDIGAYQHGSLVANGGTCFFNAECLSVMCSNGICSGSVLATPTVAITSPVSGSSITAGTNLTITASASEANGTITNISIYNGTALLGSSGLSSYSMVMNNIAAGSYALTATATDANGILATSAPVTVTVTAPPLLPSLPTVAITSPADGSSFTAGDNVTVTAAASEANGSIAKVSLFNGAGVLLNSANGNSLNFINTNIQAGPYTFTAQTQDANGMTASSVPVTVTVKAAPVVPVVPSLPQVSITSPAGGSHFTAGSAINLAASASENNGIISKVAFYSGSSLLGTATASPFALSWQNPTAGSYSLTAIATDNGGVSVTSAAVSITVTAPVVAPTIVITAALNNASFTIPSNIILTANVTDSAPARVDYYAGSIYLGEATSSPYNVNWNSAQAGTYSITAKATDTNGNVFFAPAVNITVNAHMAPSVSMLSPANNATVRAYSNLSLSSSVTAHGGYIAKVDYYANGWLYLGSAYSGPSYKMVWYNVRPGTYSISAKATDSSGWTTMSNGNKIVVK